MPTDRALGWDEEPIPADEFNEGGGDYVTLEPGEYDFEVLKFDRAKHTPKQGGSGKLPPCNKAIVTLMIQTDLGTAFVKHNLFLHTKCNGMNADFFRCLGLRKHGDPLVFPWDRLSGCTGHVKIKNRQYDGKTYNEVDRFIDPPEQTATQATEATADEADSENLW